MEMMVEPEPTRVDGVGRLDRFGPASRVVRSLGRPWLVALLVWAVAAPLAAMVPVWSDLDPFLQQGGVVPLAIGGAALLAAGCVGWRWRSDNLVGAGAGLLAAFVVLVLRSSLHGTPFGFEGVTGDSGRLSAMVTRYSVSWGTSDGIVAGVPAEYPPLFPWLLGHLAALFGTAPWRMLQPGEIIWVSGSVLAGFALWLRLVPATTALAISALVLTCFGEADKAYEVMALAVVVPWILLTFAAPAERRPHWLTAGAIGGVLVLTYHAYLLFSLIGVVGIVYFAARSAPDREGYLRHVRLVALVMAVISSWYVIPYGWSMLTGAQMVGDMYQASEVPENPFPFLAMTPIGLVQLAGLAGLLYYRRSMWWARALLAILLSAYLYRAIGLIRYVTVGHTGLFYYTTPLISACLVAGGVLAAGQAVPVLARRLRAPIPVGTGLVVVSLIVAFAGYTYWSGWMPVNNWVATQDGSTAQAQTAQNHTNYLAAQAQAQPYPDGRSTKYADSAAQDVGGKASWFPTVPIQRAVEKVLGKGARPRTLCYDEQLFAFLPWKGYLGVDRDASYAPVRWDARFAEVYRLSTSRDLTDDSEHTEFGRIDVFVLHLEGAGLVWRPLRVPEVPTFHLQQFDPAHWITENLPNSTFLAIRRP